MGDEQSPSTSTYCYSLNCSVRLESSSSMSKQGTVSAKSATVTLGRNAERDIVLQLELSGKNNTVASYLLSDCVVHQKYVKNGVGSIEIKSKKLILQMQNCPPRKLNIFLKSLNAKLELLNADRTNNFETPLAKQRRLFSGLPDVFNVLSPLTVGEIRRVRKLRGVSSPLAALPNGTSPKTPKLGIRKRDYQATTPLAPTKPFPSQETEESRLPLTLEQRIVMRNVVKYGKNVFCTGGAGTGKSLVLRRIVELLPSATCFVTAATGVAACQLGGMTLHSFAGIGIGGDPELCLKRALNNKSIVRQWRICTHLIIDEISMIDADYFDSIEYVARHVRNDDRPFGGIQLLVTGDFFQLPPVVKGNQTPKFAFESAAWPKCIMTTIVLKEVRRQKDSGFISMLNSIRIGKCDSQMSDNLIATRQVDFGEVVPTRLCTHVADAEAINSASLDRLEDDEIALEAVDERFIPDHLTTVPKKIILKKGSQVMLTKNLDLNRGLSNGARGVITQFSPRGYPVVKFQSTKEEIEIKPVRFLVRIPDADLPVSRHQFPLQLAWAISIHKSQGLTLDAVEINLSNVFVEGQAYVALSRARGLDSLRVVGFQSYQIKANEKVTRYYESLEIDGNEHNEDAEDGFIVTRRRITF